jgi:NitT/TauT family transport system permease protein
MKQTGRWFVRTALPPLAFFLLSIVAWQAVTVLWNVPRYLVPPPGVVLEVVRENAGELFHATRMTAQGALCGFGISLVVGTLLGLLFSQSRIIERSIYPYAIFLQTVPIVAIAPLVIAWFGNGFTSVVVVSITLSVFPIIANATAGLTMIDSQLLELFEVNNASASQVLLKLRMPSAVPHLVTGAKISCGLSVIGAIVGEIFAGFASGSQGLGYLITTTVGRVQTAYLFAAVLCSTLLSIAIFAAVNLLGATILARWHVTAPSRSAIDH